MGGISGIGEELVDPLSQGGDLFGIGGEKIDLADLASVGQRHRLVVIVIIADNVAAGILRNLRADFMVRRRCRHGAIHSLCQCEVGRALLAREGRRAIEKFKLANAKGPHFADPLEGWGETLMTKNQSHLALGKFAEVEKYAPNWGRLHLRWGEALSYARKPDEAKKQFARAAGLDPMPGEKAELSRQLPYA
jgi:hypothetical protein